MANPITKLLLKLRRKQPLTKQPPTKQPPPTKQQPPKDPSIPKSVESSKTSEQIFPFPFLNLPNDLLFQIARDHLDARDIRSLIQVNHHLEALLAPLLRQSPVAGMTVLHWAAWKGYERLVAILIEQGLDVNARSVSYCTWTPLHFACHKSERIVRLLLKNGADVNAQDRIGCTILHYAALGQNKEQVEALLESGVNVEIQDTFGRTALHCAAAVGADDVLRLLLDAGADFWTKDLQGRTALDHAIELRRVMCVRRLANLEGRKVDKTILYPPRSPMYMVCLN